MSLNFYDFSTLQSYISNFWFSYSRFFFGNFYRDSSVKHIPYFTEFLNFSLDSSRNSTLSFFRGSSLKLFWNLFFLFYFNTSGEHTGILCQKILLIFYYHDNISNFYQNSSLEFNHYMNRELGMRGQILLFLLTLKANIEPFGNFRDIFLNLFQDSSLEPFLFFFTDFFSRVLFRISLEITS